MLRSYLPAIVALAFAFAARSEAQQTSCSPPASTYELIQAGIFEQHGCDQSFCHGTDRVAGVDLRAGSSYQSLLQGQSGDDPDEDDVPGAALELVEPGHPEASLLWLTLAKKTLGLTDVPGTPMPIGRLPITSDELQGVSLWILAGAPQTGVVNGVSDLIDPCPPTAPAEDEALPPPCPASDRDLLLPDLVAEPPEGVRVLYRSGHRVISFSTALANVGSGPLIVQAASRPTGPGQSLDAMQIIQRADGSKCSRPAGAILFKVEGKQWSYGDLAEFELRKGNPFTGQVVARRNKAFFCLLDTDPIRAADDLPHQYEAHCEDDVGRMGISVGYKDVYHRVHPGQWLDLDADPSTTVQPGMYFLVNVVDPLQTLSETNGGREANLGYTRVRVSLPAPATGEDQPAAAARQPKHPARPAQPARPAHPTGPSGTVQQPASPQPPTSEPPPQEASQEPPPQEASQAPPGTVHQPRPPHQPHQPSGPIHTTADRRPVHTVHSPHTPHQPQQPGSTQQTTAATEPAAQPARGPHTPHQPHQPHQPGQP